MSKNEVKVVKAAEQLVFPDESLASEKKKEDEFRRSSAFLNLIIKEPNGKELDSFKKSLEKYHFSNDKENF